MTRVDQFESVFKAADKPVFTYQREAVRRVLLVTDLDPEESQSFSQRVRGFLRVLEENGDLDWQVIGGDESRTVDTVMELVGRHKPDLICIYRSLHSQSWRWPHSLGQHVDVLTQATPYPVLVLPHPRAGRALDHTLENTDRVMAMAAHLTGDDRLVNYAARFTQAGGTLFLTHIEDQTAFESLMEIISKVPAIDTETAREEISERLLREPSDYIRRCREALKAEELPVVVQEIVTMGHRLGDYQRLISDHQIDLLVLNTKDEDQLAMHGMAYPLAVELREIPLLML